MEHFTVNNGKMVDTPKTKSQKFWTRMFLFLMVAGAGIAAMFIAAPDANADMNSYLQRLANLGYTGPIVKWEAMGNAICQMQGKYTTAQIAYAIVATTGAGIYTEDAYEIIGVANDELCYGRSVAA